jgi:hypothetical protein
MAEASLKSLKAILETIREQADFVLKQLQKSEEERSTRVEMQRLVDTLNISPSPCH